MQIIKKIWIIPVLLSLFSCTKLVWETRDDCPCVLTLDLSHIPPEVNTLHLWVFDSQNNVIYQNSLGSEYFGRDYTIDIKRDYLRYFVWGNIGEATILKDDSSLNTALLKKENRSLDPLYYSAEHINTEKSETARDTVFVNKEFIQVDVSLKGGILKGDDIRLEVYSQTAGLCVDRRFVEGIGNTIISPLSIMAGQINFRYRLCRQKDLSDLSMSLIATHQGNSIILEHFPLGKWLSDQGYDMSAQILSDVKIEFDSSTSLITIKAEDWVITIPSDIEI